MDGPFFFFCFLPNHSFFPFYLSLPPPKKQLLVGLRHYNAMSHSLTQRGNARYGGGVAVAAAANSAAVVDISVCYANHFLFLQNRLICCTSKMLHWPVTTPTPSTSFVWLTRGTLTMVLRPPSRRGMGRRTPSVSSRFGRELPHLC